MAHTRFFRGASIALCVFLMLPSLAAEAGSAPLGTLRSEGAVYVDSARVPGQSSIFSGDRVATTEGRASISLPHGSSVMLDASSAAAIKNTGSGYSVGLVKGRITVNSAPQTPVQIEAEGLTVASQGSFPSLAEVAMLADGSVSLTVHRGTMVVRNGHEEPVVVKAGRMIAVNPEKLQKEQTPGTAAHGGKTASQAVKGIHIGGLSHSATVAVIGAVAVGTAAAIAIPLAVNNDNTPVSPAAP